MAKLLSNKYIISGLGAQLCSEVAGRLWTAFEIRPDYPIEQYCQKTKQIQPFFLKIVAVIRTLWKMLLNGFGDQYNPNTHSPLQVQKYLLQFLQTYRKPNSQCFSFLGIQTPKMAIKFNEQTPQLQQMKIYIPQDIVINGPKQEQWCQTNNEAQLTKTGLGVGIVWWHSIGDYKKMEQNEKPTQIFKPNLKKVEAQGIISIQKEIKKNTKQRKKSPSEQKRQRARPSRLTRLLSRFNSWTMFEYTDLAKSILEQ